MSRKIEAGATSPPSGQKKPARVHIVYYSNSRSSLVKANPKLAEHLRKNFGEHLASWSFEDVTSPRGFAHDSIFPIKAIATSQAPTTSTSAKIIGDIEDLRRCLQAPSMNDFFSNHLLLPKAQILTADLDSTDVGESSSTLEVLARFGGCKPEEIIQRGDSSSYEAFIDVTNYSKDAGDQPNRLGWFESLSLDDDRGGYQRRALFQGTGWDYGPSGDEKFRCVVARLGETPSWMSDRVRMLIALMAYSKKT
ncbi:unnamed protein product [Clonostachys rosea]|uniref:EthD domain-containing protein n=1 Tax=Bionectria ochroleuca TaxID=29856 RepID=A0ABY6U8D9_BIOOC|nr:unnamed protein product [Clonostachys rosea]